MVRLEFKPALMAFLLGAALLAAAVPAAAQTIQDVPPNHWAYEAVVQMVNRGYLALEDGRFQGNQPVDRFTLAQVIAKILNEIETGAVEPQSRQDVELLRRLVTEFREELVAVYASVERSQSRADENARELLVVKDKMSEVIAVVDQVRSELEALDRALAEGLAEQDAKRQAELQAQAAQLQSSLSQLRQLLTDDRQALRAEVAAMVDELRRQNEERIAALEASVRQALAESGIALGGLEESLRADSARLQALESEVKALSEDLDTIAGWMEEALQEIRSELNAQSEALAAQQLALEEQRQRGTALEQTDAELLGGLQAVQERMANLDRLVGRLEEMAGRLDAMKAQVDSVERQVLAMQSQIGLSDEQLRALSDRLMAELESQYQHSFLLAGTLAEEVKALREEFNSYRQNTERELQSARSAQMFGIVGALLGLIGLAN